MRRCYTIKKCIKCERQIRSVLENVPEEKIPETMHKYLQEGKKYDYGEFLAEINVEFNQEVMMHGGEQTIVYKGNLCERCLDDLCKNGIITTEDIPK